MNTAFKTTLHLSLTLLTLHQTISMKNHINGTAGMAATLFVVIALYLFYRISNRIIVMECDTREAKATYPFRS